MLFYLVTFSQQNFRLKYFNVFHLFHVLHSLEEKNRYLRRVCQELQQELNSLRDERIALQMKLEKLHSRSPVLVHSPLQKKHVPRSKLLHLPVPVYFTRAPRFYIEFILYHVHMCHFACKYTYRLSCLMSHKTLIIDGFAKTSPCSIQMKPEVQS